MDRIMKYMGSKRKHANEIYEAIIGYLGDEWSDKPWVEPFVGGANMIECVPNTHRRIGSDVNVHIIEMFKSVQNGWVPPENVSEELYKELKTISSVTEQNEMSDLIGFVGVGCSYGAKWFDGFARDGNGRNYAKETSNSLIKQLPLILDVEFLHGSYDEIEIPSNSIIYCDPPYRGTKQYRIRFDYDKFWDWCYLKSQDGHKVFVSEYQAPEPWKCIWSKRVRSSLSQGYNPLTAIERLFAV